MSVAVKLLANGRLQVSGECRVVGAEGAAVPVAGAPVYLCRCGASAKKPFCDATHKTVDFQG